MKRQTTQGVSKAEEDINVGRAMATQTPPPRKAGYFHCQKAAEKYLKALHQELAATVPKTHDLEDLLDLLLPHDAALAPLGRGLASLTKYAVEYRYPGLRATARQMQSALRIADRVRTELRARLGMPP